MKDEPAKHRKEYAPAWDAAINRFTAEFIKDFCFPDGSIDWEKLVRLVSEREASPRDQDNLGAASYLEHEF